MTQPITIDSKMHGLEGITGTFLVRGEKTALIETGPKSTVDNVLGGLEQNGVEHLDWIVVTHIHLDHAGAAGTLAQRFPEAKVAVHPVGAPHLVDPSKLWKSASRIYGDGMEDLWGGIDPIPNERILVIEDGSEIDLGGRRLRALETPGHAYHHHAYLDDATGAMFTGDALGVRLPEVGVVRPATPPPEFHLEKAVQSIRRIRDIGPTSLWLTHFGPHDEGERTLTVDDFCESSIEALQTWDTWVTEARRESSGLEEIATQVQARARRALEGGLQESAVKRMERTTSYWMNTSGYMRYQDKKEA
ncbi:MAG: MBL fold metallo-hydrolase [Actinomycetota bacterium]|nr:MBL fold metallo-hydrolase [Actinomycetota bacterium]